MQGSNSYVREPRGLYSSPRHPVLSSSPITSQLHRCHHLPSPPASPQVHVQDHLTAAKTEEGGEKEKGRRLGSGAITALFAKLSQEPHPAAFTLGSRNPGRWIFWSGHIATRATRLLIVRRKARWLLWGDSRQHPRQQLLLTQQKRDGLGGTGSSQPLGNLHIRAQRETHLSLAWGWTTPANVGFDGRAGPGWGYICLVKPRSFPISLDHPRSPEAGKGGVWCSHIRWGISLTQKGAQ